MAKNKTEEVKKVQPSATFERVMIGVGVGTAVGHAWRLLSVEQKAEILSSPGVWAGIAIIAFGVLRPWVRLAYKKLDDFLEPENSEQNTSTPDGAD